MYSLEHAVYNLGASVMVRERGVHLRTVDRKYLIVVHGLGEGICCPPIAPQRQVTLFHNSLAWLSLCSASALCRTVAPRESDFSCITLYIVIRPLPHVFFDRCGISSTTPCTTSAPPSWCAPKKRDFPKQHSIFKKLSCCFSLC